MSMCGCTLTACSTLAAPASAVTESRGASAFRRPFLRPAWPRRQPDAAMRGDVVRCRGNARIHGACKEDGDECLSEAAVRHECETMRPPVRGPGLARTGSSVRQPSRRRARWRRFPGGRTPSSRRGTKGARPRWAVVLYRVGPANSVVRKLSVLLAIEGITLLTAGFPDFLLGLEAVYPTSCGY